MFSMRLRDRKDFCMFGTLNSQSNDKSVTYCATEAVELSTTNTYIEFGFRHLTWTVEALSLESKYIKMLAVLFQYLSMITELKC